MNGDYHATCWAFTMNRATRIIFLVFGVVTTFFVSVGGLFLLTTLFSVFPTSKLNDAEGPYTSYFFILYSLTNLAFLVALGIAALRLFKNKQSGLTLLVWTLKLELGYWICMTLFWSLPSPWAMSAARATGIGNMGIAPQIYIAYPISAIVILWILRTCKMLTVEPRVG